MSYVLVDLASGSRPKPRTQTGQHDGEEDFRGEVDLEKGCEALLELKRYMSSEPIENAQLYTTQSHVKAPDDHVENISNLSKLRCELFAAREAGQLIGDEGFHTIVYLRDVDVYGRMAKQSSWRRSMQAFSSLIKESPKCTTVAHPDQDKNDERHLLRNLNVVVEPGEMVLVLGRPGSGCTSFLKTVSRQLDSNCRVAGNFRLLRSGSDKDHNLKNEQTLFCAANDVHMPTLTVKQTLQFALASKLPHQDAKSQTYVLDSLLNIFKLSHQADTLIGDALLRGVSGGERKRVSIAEALLSRPSVACWDNSTLGLDAGSASDFIKCLRMLTDTYQMTTFAALYQASDTLYELFDKVLVLEDGHQAYFGPSSAAKAYFEQQGFPHSPGQPLSDYLIDCVDSRNRSLEHSLRPDELANIYRDSACYKAVIDQQERTIDNAAQHAVSTGATLQGPKPSLSYYNQILLTAKRHALLRLQDKLGLAVKGITAIVVSIIVGTMYWQLPKTSAGAFTRGGVIFITLLYNAFTAFVELPSAIFGRPVLRKHTALGFHRPSAMYLGQFCIDVPFAAVEILIFIMITYLMAGLTLSASSFFIFYILVVLGQATMAVFFRTLGCISRNMDFALRLASIVIMLMILTSGYMVPYKDIQPCIKWFYWLNPLAYDFSALMLNEFANLSLQCILQSLVPNGPDYNATQYQVCTLPGAVPQRRDVDGESYLLAAFGFAVQHFKRNIAIMVVFLTGLLIINVLIGEFVTFSSTVQRSKTIKRRRQKLADQEKGSQIDASGEPLNLVASKSVITWENISYTLPTLGGGSKELLNNVDGFVEPGTLMALMGPSGAGKSTLLDVLSRRKNVGVVTGTLQVDGGPPSSAFSKAMGYCEQADVHDPQQTVREALLFSALLRQPQSTPKKDKEAHVDQLLQALELMEVADALIGDSDDGLSVEERKRLTIGVELAAKPDVLLLLDEPTSGLDSQSALSIVRLLRKLADSGAAIICTIHQPSATVFGLFDRLLILHHGRTVYCASGNELRSYLTHNGENPGPEANIAEYVLQMLVDSRQHDQIDANPWADKWTASERAGCNKSYIERLKYQARQRMANSTCSPGGAIYSSPFRTQVQLVTARAMLSSWRLLGYVSTRIFNHVVIALLTGLTYLNIGNALVDAQYRIFIVFQVTVLPSLLLSQVEARYHVARSISERERSSKMYSSLAFVLANIASELPLSLVCSVVFFALLYYMVGFNPSPSRAGFQFLMIFLTENFSVALGQAVAALTPSTYIASLFTPFLLITLSLMCGVTVPPPAIPRFWRVWLYRLNPFTYLVGGMVETEMHGLSIQCRPQELNIFQPPEGQTCAAYAADYLTSSLGFGYLKNPGSTKDCAYCPWRSGDDFISQFGLSWEHRWRDLGIIGVFWLTTIFLLIVAGTRLKFVKR